MGTSLTSESSFNSNFNFSFKRNNWKARVSAYEEVSKGANVNADLLRDCFKKCLADGNAVALSSALEMLMAVLHRNCGAEYEMLVKLQASFIPQLVGAKCLGSARNATKERAANILLELIDCDTSTQAAIDELVNQALTAKQPKLVASCVQLVRDVVHLYGWKMIVTDSVKLILKMLIQLSSHQDATVRSECQQLAVEIYRWQQSERMFEQHVYQHLKPVQIKELQAQFSQVSNEAMQPQRVIISMRAQVEASAAVALNVEIAEVAPQEDVEEEVELDMAVEVDVLKSVPDDLETKLADKQWKERRDALEILLKLLDTPKYALGPYHQLLSMLVKRVNDVNLAVVTLAVQCIEKVAFGLRGRFENQYRTIVASALLDRLKEKKTAVVIVVKAALDAVFYGASVSELSNGCVEFLSNRVPQVRAEVGQLIQRQLKSQKRGTKVSKADLKLIVVPLVKLCDDATAECRDAAIQALGALLQLAGEGAVAQYLQSLDQSKQDKISEYKHGDGVIAAQAAPVAGSKDSDTAVGKENVGTFPGTSLGRRASRPMSVASKPASASGTTKKKQQSRPVSKQVTTKPSSAASKQTLLAQDEEIRYKWTQNDALMRGAELFGEDLSAKLNDTTWKVRLEAIELLASKVDAANDNEQPGEFLVRYLQGHPVWKDSNFQVLNAMFKLLLAVVCREGMGRNGASLFCSLLIEKIGDLKLKSCATEALNAIVDAFGIGFVIQYLPDAVTKLKAPKAINESLRFAAETIMAYGVERVNVRDLIAMCKTQIGSPNQLVRGGVVQLLVALRTYVGPDMRSLLNDVSPAQLAIIDAEFEKVPSTVPVPPKRAKCDPAPLVGVTDQATAYDTVPATAASPVVDLFERVDLDTLLPSDCLHNMSNSNWKLRKEALDQLQQSIEKASYCIQPPSHQLISSLKPRLSDSNKMLTLQAMDIAAALARATGPRFERIIKPYCSLIVNNMNDLKPTVRASAVLCWTAIAAVSTAATLMEVLIIGLNEAGPNARRELLDWITANNVRLRGCNNANQLLPGYIQCWQDKVAEVRKSSQNALQSIVDLCGRDSVYSSFSEAKIDTAPIDVLKTSIPAERVESVPINDSPRVSKMMPSRTASAISLKSRTAAKRKSTASLSVSAAPEPSHQVAFKPQDDKLKIKRTEQDRGAHKWTFDVPRKDLVEFLAEQSADALSDELVRLMFTEDHNKDKNSLMALNVLGETLAQALTDDLSTEDITQRIIASSDILLKYLSIRLFDTNTTILLKSLEVCEALLTRLDTAQYCLTDYEVGLCLPALIIRVGDAKENVRAKVRAIIKLYCRVHPASKVFIHLLTGLTAKNARVRIECLEEMANLIQRNGMNVCNPQKAMPQVAAQVSDRDAGVRNAAIDVLVSVHGLIGVKVYALTGRMADKDKSFVEDRIKRNSTLAPPLVSTRPFSTPVKLSSNDKLVLSDDASAVREPVSVQRPLSLQPPKVSIASQVVGARNSQYIMDVLLTQICGDVHQATDALKHLEKHLCDDVEMVRPQVDRLVEAVTLQLREVFSSPVWMTSADNTYMLKLCRHLVNTLVSVFSNAELASSLNRKTMKPLMQTLVTRLTQPLVGINVEEASAQLTRAFNVLLLRVLENCNMNDLYAVLMELLETGIAEIDVSNDFTIKFAEMAMKCMWKLTKSLAAVIRQDNFDVRQLLVAIHLFFQRSPPAVWKQRAQAQLPLGDVPHRTMKTILHEVCVVMGTAACDLMLTIDEIENPSSSVVYTYLQQMSKTPGSPIKNRPVTLVSVTPAPAHTPVAAAVDMPRVSQADRESALNAIFAKISDKTKTRVGIQELHAFRQQHPDSQPLIDAQMSHFGSYFRTYVQDNLSQLDNVKSTPTALFDSPSTARAVDSAVNETKNYKERLARLQQMLKPAASPAYNLGPRALPDHLREQAAMASPTRQQSASVTESPRSSVEQIKERLAKMKESMAAMNLNKT